MKKILSLCLVFFFLFSVKVSAKDIGILIDGKTVEFTESTGSPFADENSRTQVPLRVTMESYGALVDWDQSTQTAIVSNNGIVVKVPMGAQYIIVNDVKKVADDVKETVHDVKNVVNDVKNVVDDVKEIKGGNVIDGVKNGVKDVKQTVQDVKENRTDYCFHSNYLVSPEKFFSQKNLLIFLISLFY